MGALFGGPKIPPMPAAAVPPPPLPPAPMPDPGDLQIAAQKKRKAAATSRTGRLSTILSDAGGGEVLGG